MRKEQDRIEAQERKKRAIATKSARNKVGRSEGERAEKAGEGETGEGGEGTQIEGAEEATGEGGGEGGGGGGGGKDENWQRPARNWPRKPES